jgi:hypothetical protein
MSLPLPLGVEVVGDFTLYSYFSKLSEITEFFNEKSVMFSPRIILP